MYPILNQLDIKHLSLTLTDLKGKKKHHFCELISVLLPSLPTAVACIIEQLGNEQEAFSKSSSKLLKL